MGGESNSLGIVQEIKIWPCKQVVYARFEICPEEWDTLSSLGFWDTNGSSLLGQMTSPSDNQQKEKRTCRIGDFATPADHRVKLK